MQAPDPDALIREDYQTVVAMVRSGAKHACGVKLDQKSCQVLETMLKRSVDIGPLVEAFHGLLNQTIECWRLVNDGK